MKTLKEFESKTGYAFKDSSLLKTALTHRSYLNEDSSKSSVCNERMEFLGDAVLQIAVSDYIYMKYPILEEGKMSQMRSVVVCENGLFELAKDWGLGDFLFMSSGEEATGGREKSSILSDAVEATIAAVYLDSDFFTAKDFAIRHLEKYIISAVENKKSEQDYKSRLQELAMAKGHKIEYSLIDATGPDHEKTFTVKATYSDGTNATGIGRGKKKAEQQAAKKLLEKLKKLKK